MRRNNKLVLWLIPFLMVDIAIGLRNGDSHSDRDRNTMSLLSELQMEIKQLRSETLAVKIMVKRCGADVNE